jgi:hypothetical protein
MRTRRQGMLLAVASWAGLLIDVSIDAEWLLVMGTYGVGLAIVLWDREKREERITHPGSPIKI